MNPTRISVALATYNGEKYLPEQLASIAAQTRRPDEIVVGDDQSSDGTEELLRRFGHDIGIAIRFTRNPVRLGSSANFGAVLERCQGDVIFLCDQDDVWAPNKVEKSLAVLNAHPEVGFVFSNANLISGSGQLLGGTLWSRVFFDRAGQEKFRQHRGSEALLKTNAVTGATMAVRRSALAPALPIPAGWVHDGWLAFVIELVAGGLPIDEPLLSYRLHAAQQIGVVGWSPQKLRALVRKQDAAFYRGEAANYRALAQRLTTLGPSYANTATRAIAKAAFLDRRARGRENLGACLRAVVGAMFARSYEHYGMGAKQAVFDLLGGFDAAGRRFRSQT